MALQPPAPTMPDPQEWDDDAEFDEEVDEDEFLLDHICGMMPNGQCTLAGTEECDWECPRNI